MYYALMPLVPINILITSLLGGNRMLTIRILIDNWPYDYCTTTHSVELTCYFLPECVLHTHKTCTLVTFPFLNHFLNHYTLHEVTILLNHQKNILKIPVSQARETKRTMFSARAARAAGPSARAAMHRTCGHPPPLERP